MAFKAISLLASTWGAIATELDGKGTPEATRQAALIREQLDGSVQVKVTRGHVTMKAKKGGDLRNSLVAP